MAEAVAALKAEGNAMLKACDFAAALDAYERAIAACPAAMAETRAAAAQILGPSVSSFMDVMKEARIVLGLSPEGLERWSLRGEEGERREEGRHGEFRVRVQGW